jgi:hypothetical protein
VKLCTKCGVEKLRSDFWKHARCADGLQSHCKSCCRAAMSKWGAANRARHNARSAKWKTANPDSVRAIAARWADANRGRVIARHAKRRAAKLQRTPAWVDQAAIAAIYAQAEEAGMHVDHVIPLQGRLVSGLHVHNNLQLLTKSENSSKRNHFEVN